MHTRASAQHTRGVKCTHSSQGSSRPFGGVPGKEGGASGGGATHEVGRSPVDAELLELEVPGFCP